jgi:hypothetical protein
VESDVFNVLKTGMYTFIVSFDAGTRFSPTELNELFGTALKAMCGDTDFIEMRQKSSFSPFCPNLSRQAHASIGRDAYFRVANRDMQQVPENDLLRAIGMIKSHRQYTFDHSATCSTAASRAVLIPTLSESRTGPP